MKYKILYTDRAKSALINTLYYIAADNPKRAVTYIDEIEAAISRLSDYPYMGVILHGNNCKSQNRLLIHGNYKIVYEIGYEKSP